MENEQFVNVHKNGIPGRLHITTWERIGKENNKEGWILTPNQPAEVAEIREKKIALGLNNQSENVIAEKVEIKPEEIIKEKRKYTKK